MEKIVWFYDFDRVFDQHYSRYKNIFLYFAGINKTYVQKSTYIFIFLKQWNIANFTMIMKRGLVFARM